MTVGSRSGRALFVHSSTATQRGHSSNLSRQRRSQYSHETGQLRAIQSLFFSHSPRCANPGHLSSVSAQTGLQSPHDVGHSGSMNDGLESHSPSFAQPGQSAFASLQENVHTPHERGHAGIMASGLCTHSPAAAQCPQLLYLSTQIPATPSTPRSCSARERSASIPPAAYRHACHEKVEKKCMRSARRLSTCVSHG